MKNKIMGRLRLGEPATITKCVAHSLHREGEAPAEPLTRVDASPGSRLSRSLFLPREADGSATSPPGGRGTTGLGESGDFVGFRVVYASEK